MKLSIVDFCDYLDYRREMQKKREVTLGLVQMAMEKDLSQNLEKAISHIREAKKRGADIICLPELFKAWYFCQEEDHDFFQWAETIPGPSTQVFEKVAKELGVVLITSLFEKRAEGLYHNTAVVFDENGKSLGVYRKMHIPDDPHYYEKFYFTPGDLGFKTFNTRFGKIGLLVCWDQWFPEAARLTALKGAEIIFYPTAIGWHPKEKNEFGEAQKEAWITIQRSHAIANGCFVASVNRVGHEAPSGGDGIEFWGNSFLCGPDGKIQTQAAHQNEEILIQKIDFSKVDVQRTHWPFLRDRRIDFYSDLSKRYLDDSNS